MVQVSFTLPLPHDKRAEGAALQLASKMGLDPALLVHAKAMGPDFTFFVVYGSGRRTSSTCDEVDGRRARVPAADRQGGQPRDQEAAAPQARRRRRLHRHRRPHRRHRRDPQHQGLRGGEGPGVLPRDQGREPRRPGARARARRAGPGREGRRRPRQPGRHPEGRPHPQHDADVGRVPRGLPRRAGAAARRRRPAVRGGLGAGASASTGSSAAARRPARSPATSSTRSTPRTGEERHDRSDRPRRASGTRVTHRRYVPYSHAHYAGNLVDGAYSLAAFGDVATEMCIRTDGDEGLFASYADVQFRAPVRAGDVIEIEAELVRVGHRRREMDFEVRVVARGTPERGDVRGRVARPAGRRHDRPRGRRRPLTAPTSRPSPRCTATVNPVRRLLLSLIAGGLLCLAFPTFDVWVAAPVALALLGVGLGRCRGSPRLPARAGRWSRLLRPDAQLVGHLRRRTALDRPRDPARRSSSALPARSTAG